MVGTCSFTQLIMNKPEEIEVVVKYKPCNCDAMDGQHHHLDLHTIIPWEIFKREIMKKPSGLILSYSKNMEIEKIIKASTFEVTEDGELTPKPKTLAEIFEVEDKMNSIGTCSKCGYVGPGPKHVCRGAL